MGKILLRELVKMTITIMIKMMLTSNQSFVIIMLALSMAHIPVFSIIKFN